jgi:serine protease Do
MASILTYLTGPRKGQSERFELDRISIGRAEDNSFSVDPEARRVSAHHASIIHKGDSFVLHDLGSTNGTMINGRRIITSEIKGGDLIEFGAGGPLVRFTIEPDESSAVLTSPTTEAAIAIPRIDSGDDPGRSGIGGAHHLSGNGRLVAGLVVAMLIGATAGLMFASRVGVSTPSQMGFAEVAERNGPAVVYIRTEYELVDAAGHIVGREARSGSGFVVSPNGLIVTNRHLIRDWDYNQPAPGVTGRTTSIEVIFPGGRREDAIPGDLVKIAPTLDVDVAIIKVRSTTPPPAVLRLEPGLERINQGDEVVVIGYPLGLDLMQLTNQDRVQTSLSVGVVSQIGPEYIQLSLRAYQGSSGGPVLSRRGEVIGLITANVGNAQDITLCTPAAAALKLMGDDFGSRAGIR